MDKLLVHRQSAWRMMPIGVYVANIVRTVDLSGLPHISAFLGLIGNGIVIFDNLKRIINSFFVEVDLYALEESMDMTAFAPIDVNGSGVCRQTIGSRDGAVSDG